MTEKYAVFVIDFGIDGSRWKSSLEEVREYAREKLQQEGGGSRAIIVKAVEMMEKSPPVYITTALPLKEFD